MARLLLLGITAWACAFGESREVLPDFSSLTLQELSTIKVTSVSKTQHMLSRVAAAVYVITRDEIHRSGMTNVADVLRIVPGITVARLDGSQWAVTSRGFNGRFANKLLVLVDGRSLYTPIFSGVYWDMSMPLLDDIERIEVIRGPGASVWGANAVNGVINIITKQARDARGVSITAGGGTSERAFGQIRVGGNLSSIAAIRGYFAGYNRSALQTPGGQDAHDGWSSAQGGFRIDSSNEKGGWQLEADIYRSRRGEASGLASANPALPDPVTYADYAAVSSNIALEWRRNLSEKSDIRVTTYYDFINRPELSIPVEQTRTGDVEVQYHFTPNRYHDILFGAADRLISEKVIGTAPVSFTPSEMSYHLSSGFAQDEIHLFDDRLLVTIGAKIEHSVFGGWQLQPTERILWAPNKQHSAWVSISRAARTPAFYERNITADAGPPFMGPSGLPAVVTVNGSPAFHSEIMKGYEAGYRAQISPRLSVDIAGFLNDYDGMKTQTPGKAFLTNASRPHLAAPYLILPYMFTNYLEASASGGEFSTVYHPVSRWKIAGSYSYLNVHQHLRKETPPR